MIKRIEDSWEALDGKYRVKLESFLAHARRRVVTSPQKVPIIATPLSDLVLSTHAVSSIFLSFWKAILTERGP